MPTSAHLSAFRRAHGPKVLGSSREGLGCQIDNRCITRRAVHYCSPMGVIALLFIVSCSCWDPTVRGHGSPSVSASPSAFPTTQSPHSICSPRLHATLPAPQPQVSPAPSPAAATPRRISTSVDAARGRSAVLPRARRA